MIIKFKVNNLFYYRIYFIQFPGRMGSFIANQHFAIIYFWLQIVDFCNQGGGNKNIPNMNRKLFRNDSNVIELVPTEHILKSTKVGCVFPMVAVSMLPRVEVRRNDHREDAPHFKSTLGTDSSFLHLVMFRVNIKIFQLEWFQFSWRSCRKEILELK